MTPTSPNKILLAVVSLLFSVAVLEVIGRTAISQAPARQDGFLADSKLGWTLPAGTTMMWRGKAAQINSLGLRGPEPRAEATTRILIVGDSSVFGDGLSDGQTMSAQVSALLGPSVDVQNGGVPGYTCEQSRILLDRILARFQPDILISYNQHSDFRRANPDDRVMFASQLGALGSTGIGRLISAGMLWRRMQSNGANLDRSEYQACLSEMASAQQARGGKMAFVVPITEVDFPDSPFFGEPEPEEEGKRLSDYRQTMKAVAGRYSAVLVDGPEAVRGAGLTGDAALQDPVHPTVAGQRALAQSILAALRQAGW